MRFRVNLKLACSIFVLAFGLASVLPLHTSVRTRQAAKGSTANTEKTPIFRFEYRGNVAQAPMDFEGNMVFLPVRINAMQPSLFLLDTTAKTSELDRDRLAELGLLQPQPVNSSSAASSKPESITNIFLGLPGIGIVVPSMNVASLAAISKNVGRSVQGVIGMDLLSHLILELDYDRLTVQFYDPTSFEYSGKGTVLPLGMANGLLSMPVKAEVPGRKTRTEQYLIDTAFAEAIEFDEPPHKTLFSHLKTRLAALSGGAASDVAEGRIKTLFIGPFEFDQPVADFALSPHPEQSGNKIAGIVGNELLRRFNVIIDMAHQHLILEPGRRLNAPFEADMSGMTLAAEGPTLKTIRVVAVEEHSPARAAGIESGDIIEGVQAEPAVDLRLSDLRELFQEPDKDFKLTVERNGKTLDVRIKLHPLI